MYSLGRKIYDDYNDDVGECWIDASIYCSRFAFAVVIFEYFANKLGFKMHWQINNFINFVVGLVYEILLPGMRKFALSKVSSWSQGDLLELIDFGKKKESFLIIEDYLN